MVKYIRQTIGAEVMMQTEHYTGPADWSDTMSYTLLPEIANKYGAELCRLREPWQEYLKKYNLAPSALLLDGVHLNPDGQAFMLGLMKQFFVYRTSNAATVLAAQTKTIQPTDWVNGKLTIQGVGTRAEIISGTGTQSPATVTVDANAPSTYKENYIRSAEVNGMSGTIMGIINYNSVPKEQVWTLEMTSYTDEKTFAVKATGSLTGDEGASVSNVLNGTHIKLDFESFIWTFTKPTVGTKYTFSSILNGCDTYSGSNKVLFSGMANANHALVLTAVNPANIPDIKAIRFYDTAATVVTTDLKPTVHPATPTPTPDPNATPTPDPAKATMDPTNMLAIGAINANFEAGGWGADLTAYTVNPGQGGISGCAAAAKWTGQFLNSPKLEDNTYYTLTYLIKTDGSPSNCLLNIGFADSRGPQGSGNAYTGNSTVWTKHTVVFKTSTGVKNIDPYNSISLSVWSATTVYIDDIQLHKGSNPTPTPPPTATPGPATPTPEVTATPTPTIVPSVTATPPIVGAVTVKLDKTTASLKVPLTLQLTATVSIPFIADNAVKWTSSNSKVATVSSSGKVTAKGPGVATITATTVTQSKKATCKVTVTQPVTSVKLSKSTLTISKGKTSKLIATINPSNASNKKVTWKSSNKAIATVTSSGVIKGIKKGTVYIYVYSVDGSKSARCKVTIK